MKKILAIIFALLVGMQTSYAAFADFCVDDQVIDIHSGHKDLSAKNIVSADDSSSESATHTDCGFCHLGHSHSFSASLLEDFGPPTSQSLNVYYSTRFPTTPPSQPEKPNWLYFA